MNKNSAVPRIASRHAPAHGTAKSYTVGFGLSIALTLMAYALVDRNVLAGWDLAMAIVGLALVQLVVQLLFFLHLGQESKPRLNLLTLLFALLVLLIVVLGSLWIMSNLNHYKAMTPAETETHIQDEELIYKKQN